MAIERVGGSAEIIMPGADTVKALLKYDGLIIPGGDDIDPAFYNEKKVFDIRQEDKKRTVFELVLLEEMIKRGKPVLGICYGMQLINVFFKGTLFQDISLRPERAIIHKDTMHEISISENPFLELGSFLVNSTHHQAIKNLGAGLRPFGYAEDGIMEAFFLDDYGFLMGVQWHPERMENEISKKVFEVFVNACKKT
jgi:putative glutamine amidotransferase